jgi:hypothetical protein
MFLSFDATAGARNSIAAQDGCMHRVLSFGAIAGKETNKD